MGRYLIINADDFGSSKSVNKAIINLLSNNIISSATLMPNANYYNEAARWAIKNSENIGLHLTFLNDDTKLKYRSLSRSKSLEDEKGLLLEDRKKFSENLRLKDIKKEIDMQFDKLKSTGINISHVDIHRYALYPTYNPIAYLYLCKKCKSMGNIPIRWARNGTFDIGYGINSLCDTDNIARFFAAISDIYTIPIPDYVFKFPYRNTLLTFEEKKEAFINIIRNLPDGISEVHIHPSVLSNEIKDINPTWSERVLEYDIMLDEDIRNIIKEEGVELITYKDIKGIRKCDNRFKAFYKAIVIVIDYSIKSLKSKCKRFNFGGNINK